jgi:hypothetical protein
MITGEQLIPFTHHQSHHLTMHLVNSSYAQPPPMGGEPGQSFEAVVGAHATIRQLIMSHLKEDKSTHALRRVSRAMRAAVDDTITTVACDLDGPRFETEMATVFPAASKLCVSWPDDTEDPEEPQVFYILLEHIMATSPALVTKLLALRLSLGTFEADGDITNAVARFLSRYVGKSVVVANLRQTIACAASHIP